jgi:phage terminase large subunit-like protein
VESEQRAIDMVQWNACVGDWKAGDPGQDHDLMKRFIHRPCYAGLDLSYTTDLTALALVFPAGEGVFDVLPFFWMAQDRVTERERRDRVPYSEWVRQGYIEAGEGNVIDYALVKKRLKWAQECFDVREVAFDPYGATQLVTESEHGLQDMGFTCVAIGQGYRMISEPTKKLLELVTAGKLRHGGHPVLRWNADCLNTKSDGNDNIRPVKPDRQTSSKRIDGIVATITALARAIVNEGRPPEFRVRVI